MSSAIIILLLFVATIFIGFKANINQGILAMVVSYIAGSFFMGIKPSDLVAMWPMKIFFILITVSFFYNFATLNGTMDKLALNIIYKFGKKTKLLPFVAFFAAYLMSGLGAGPYSILFLFCPILFNIADKVGMSKVLLGTAAYLGSVASGAFPTSSTGAVINAIMASAGYPEQAMNYSFAVFLEATLALFVVFLINYFFIFKGHKAESADIVLEKPEPYNDKQKTSITLILVFVVALLLPFILATIFKTPFLKNLAKLTDVGFVALILGTISTVLKLADEKKAISTIPWNTVIMISGISLIVGVAINAGTIEMLVSLVNSTGNKTIVPGIMSFIASCMSLVSSTTGVVIPTLYPMVPKIAEASALNPALLFSVINSGSGIVGLSPLSACGAIMMSCVAEKDVNYMYKKLFLVALGNIVIAVAVALVLGMVWN